MIAMYKWLFEELKKFLFSVQKGRNNQDETILFLFSRLKSVKNNLDSAMKKVQEMPYLWQAY